MMKAVAAQTSDARRQCIARFVVAVLVAGTLTVASPSSIARADRRVFSSEGPGLIPRREVIEPGALTVGKQTYLEQPPDAVLHAEFFPEPPVDPELELVGQRMTGRDVARIRLSASSPNCPGPEHL